MTGDPQKRNYCLNCGNKLTEQKRYCDRCGQKTDAYLLTLGKLLKDFFSTLFNWDAKIWITLRDIFIPSKLTKEYVAGKRIKYISPIRLFLVLLFICLALVTYRFNRNPASLGEEDMYINAAKIKALQDIDSLQQIYPISPQDHVECIKEEVFSDLDMDDQAFNINDLFFLDFRNLKITTKDIVYKSPEEIMRANKIEGFFKKLVLTQIIRSYKDRKGFIRTTIGNSIWMLMLTILLTALFMKLIYIRGDYFLVEHLVNLLHHHSFILLTCLISSLTLLIDIDIEQIIPYLVILWAIYIFFSVKIYYKQSWIKTLLKFFLTSIVYIFSLFICIILILFLSFLMT